MSIDRTFFNPPADGERRTRWNENALTTAAATIAVLVVALVAVLMGMA
ncbi:MAG TPA: hypothetical protein VFB45_06125 [Pseudolabrys sp.]|nr:hypothetical protein [Pseudolabrys sp.]